LGTNGEITTNSNGRKLKEFASVNELQITNTFFRHKEIHKMTWSFRGYRSIIDYILTNKKLSPLVNGTKVFRGCDVTTDHYLLISKIHLPQKWYTFTKRSLGKKKFLGYIVRGPKYKIILSEEIRAKSDALSMQP